MAPSSLRSTDRFRQTQKRSVILVVEDDDSLCNLLCLLLADEYPDYNVMGASCGPEALVFVRELGRPSFLLLDVIAGVLVDQAKTVPACAR